MRAWVKKYLNLSENVMGINERNLRLIYPHNPRKNFKLADDKILAKEIMVSNGVPVPKTIGVLRKVGDIEQFWSQLPKKSCAIKPAKGRGGGGILVLDFEDNKWTKGGEELSTEQIQRHLANIIFGVYSFGTDDAALVEEKIIQSPWLSEIFPKGIADLRVIVKEGEILMAMLRVPTNESGGRANLHQGAVGVAVEIENGQLGEVFNGKGYSRTHPDSHLEVYGKVIPEWSEVKEISRSAFSAFPLEYLGVDVAFDKDKGPLVLEVNVRPGLEIQNVNKQGLKALLKS